MTEITSSNVSLVSTGAALLKIMKPLQSLPLQMAECSLRAQPDSVSNHVRACSISD